MKNIYINGGRKIGQKTLAKEKEFDSAELHRSDRGKKKKKNKHKTTYINHCL